MMNNDMMNDQIKILVASVSPPGLDAQGYHAQSQFPVSVRCDRPHFVPNVVGAFWERQNNIQ